MSLKKYLSAFILSGMGFLSGCVSLARNPGFSDVGREVNHRMEVKLEKYDKKTGERIQPLLEQKLTANTAVQIALLNNRQLQAEFEELGITKADVLQATLIKNPKLDGFVRFPNHEGSKNTEFEISQDVISILLMPIRRRVASAQFEQAKLRVSDAVLSLVAEVKKAFYEAQAAEQIMNFQKTVLEASEAAEELADRQVKAGNLKALDFANEQAAYEQAQLDFNRSQAALLAAREPLSRLLGLSGDDAAKWQIESELSALPISDPSLEGLREKALSQRLDLAAARKQIEIFRRSLLATRLGIIQEGSIGFNRESEVDGNHVMGPTWSVDVPVFDWQQGASARTKAQLRQSQHLAAAFEVQVESEVREALNRLAAARFAAERYRDKIIPVREQIINLTQQQYNFMLKGVYDLLLARQNEILANRAYIEALKDYWIAWTDLERAVAGNLPQSKIPEKPASQPVQQTAQPMQGVQEMEHMHHQGGENQ